uniref:Uncharacterized protein n=1 Tax=Anguilla anguilla TaxID=7936 RepID=A0A0E9W8M2_ANGAN
MKVLNVKLNCVTQSIVNSQCPPGLYCKMCSRQLCQEYCYTILLFCLFSTNRGQMTRNTVLQETNGKSNS